MGDVYGFEYWPLVIFSSLNIVVQEILSSNKTLAPGKATQRSEYGSIEPEPVLRITAQLKT